MTDPKVCDPPQPGDLPDWPIKSPPVIGCGKFSPLSFEDLTDDYCLDPRICDPDSNKIDLSNVDLGSHIHKRSLASHSLLMNESEATEMMTKRTRIEDPEPPEDCPNCLAKREPTWVEPKFGEYGTLIADDDEDDNKKRSNDVSPAGLAHWGVGNGVTTEETPKRDCFLGCVGGGGGVPPVDDIEGGVDVGNRSKKRGDGGHNGIELSDNLDTGLVDHQAVFKDWEW